MVLEDLTKLARLQIFVHVKVVKEADALSREANGAQHVPVIRGNGSHEIGRWYVSLRIKRP